MSALKGADQEEEFHYSTESSFFQIFELKLEIISGQYKRGKIIV